MKTMKIKLAKLKTKSITEQMEKIKEEFLEFETAAGYQDRIEEAFDLLQSVATFLCFVADKRIDTYNKMHLTKMKRYLQCKRVKA